MNDRVESPLTLSKNTCLERVIPTQVLIEKYKTTFNFDVSPYFKNLEEIKLFKCLDTEYRFYFPFHLGGNDSFYNHFGELPWYYSPWKWEHEQCSHYIKRGMRVLEVGAAKGDFLKKISEKGIECVGLELNSKAVEIGKSQGVNLIEELVEEHAKKNEEVYDMVCSFQVLEHIGEVKSFIEANLRCLKKGGLLVISVPNNDSFLKNLKSNASILNMPPHHLGLWNKDSLSNLAKILNITLERMIYEPLQSSNFDNFQFAKVQKIFFGSYFLVRVYWKLKIYKLFRPLVKFLAPKLIGHSIMAVYNK